MYFSDESNRYIYQRNLSTAFDASSATGALTGLSLGSSIYPYSLSFDNDGTKLFVLTPTTVREYDLNTRFNVSNASLSETADLSSQDSSMRGLTFNNDGTKMFTVGDYYNRVYEYDLSSPFDVSSSSLSYTTDNYYTITSQEVHPREIKFNHDGTKMYISGEEGDDINEYTLSSPLIYHLLLPTKVVIVFLLQMVLVGHTVFLLIMMEQNFLLQVLVTIDLMNIL